MIISAQSAERKAQELLECSIKIGQIIKMVDSIGKENWQAIKDESFAYETIILGGSDLQHAMRTLAMRLDRSAIVKSKEE